jgi:ABC-type glycerol-3-phosphate transport system substrate-binding protein
MYKFSQLLQTRVLIRPVLLTLAMALTSAISSAGELTIYASMDADKLQLMGNAFSKKHPDIQIN